MPYKADVWLPNALAALAEQDEERFELFVFRLAQALPSEFAHLAAISELSLPQTDGSIVEGIIIKDDLGVARIAGSPVAVWEILRVFRNCGSVENLKSAYVGLSERELRTALSYAEVNTVEINNLIERYEASKRTREDSGYAVSSQQQ